jgi:hypothetical protein
MRRRRCFNLFLSFLIQLSDPGVSYATCLIDEQ